MPQNTMSQEEERQASAEIEVTPEMAAAGGGEIWGSPLIEAGECNELAARVYRRMEVVRLVRRPESVVRVFLDLGTSLPFVGKSVFRRPLT